MRILQATFLVPPTSGTNSSLTLNDTKLAIEQVKDRCWVDHDYICSKWCKAGEQQSGETSLQRSGPKHLYLNLVLPFLINYIWVRDLYAVPPKNFFMFSKNRELLILGAREDEDTFREVEWKRRDIFGRFKQHFLFPFLFCERLCCRNLFALIHVTRHEKWHDHVTLTS